MSIYDQLNGKDSNGFIVKCDCGTHNAEFSWFKGDEESLYLSFHLCEFVWYKRVWFGIKYIFGYRSSLGDYAELVIPFEEIQPIVDRLNKAQKEMVESAD